MTLTEALALLKEVKRENRRWTKLYRETSKQYFVTCYGWPDYPCVATDDGNAFRIQYETGSYSSHTVEALLSREAWEAMKATIEGEIARWGEGVRYPPIRVGGA